MIAELIERLEKAEGPDREIDADLVCVCCPGALVSQYIASDAEPSVFHAHALGLSDRSDVPAYTSSLDAALSLVERKLPGWKRELEEHVPTDKWPHAVFGNHYWTATIISPEWDGSGGDWRAAEECGKTPALAVCLALLRALSTEA